LRWSIGGRVMLTGTAVSCRYFRPRGFFMRTLCAAAGVAARK
jgi:hypothetical protein